MDGEAQSKRICRENFGGDSSTEKYKDGYLDSLWCDGPTMGTDGAACRECYHSPLKNTPPNKRQRPGIGETRVKHRGGALFCFLERFSGAQANRWTTKGRGSTNLLLGASGSQDGLVLLLSSSVFLGGGDHFLSGRRKRQRGGVRDG
jgi:hypothetical protein